jgi:DNA-binding transcriptional regulator YdaS (Cro superfamily)
MKTQAAIDHFGGEKALAEVLGLSETAVYQWTYRGEYPPDKRQLQIERLAPCLKAEPGCMERVLGLSEKEGA